MNTSWTMRVIGSLTLTLMTTIGAPTKSFATSDLIARLADGSPWQITMPNGRSGSLTMLTDGTGIIGMGPMRMELVWRQSSDGFCMTTRRMGDRCMTLMETQNGFITVGQDGESMQIWR